MKMMNSIMILITIIKTNLNAGDGHYRFTVTLGISLTMPNKK